MIALAPLILGTGWAWAQGDDPYPPLAWVAREFQPTAGVATDQAMEIAFWPPWPEQAACGGSEPTSYILVTGYVTEANGATRFATYKYRADWPGADPPPHASPPVFFPEDLPPPAETHKAVGLAMDCEGNVYVAGSSRRPGGTDLDIIVVKYDRDLQPLWTPHERRYNGPGSGNDVAMDIGVDPEGEAVVVIGTSLGFTGDDIVTIAFDAEDGSPPDDAWPDVGFGPGVRRYDNGGPDRAVELGGIMVGVQEGIIDQLDVVVLGTSLGLSTGDDYLLVHYASDVPAGVAWVRRYDPSGGKNDTATGLAVQGTFIYATGYSPQPEATSFSGPGGGAAASLSPDHFDYVTASFVYDNLTGALRWDHRWDYAGSNDYPADVQVLGGYIAVTGRATAGADFDAVSIAYTDSGVSGTLIWSGAFDRGTDERGAALAMPGLVGPAPDLYVAGARNRVIGATTEDGVTLDYRPNPVPPPFYFQNWWKQFTPFPGHDAWRAIAAGVPIGAPLNERPSVYSVGTSNQPGTGLDFVVARYRQTVPPP